MVIAVLRDIANTASAPCQVHDRGENQRQYRSSPPPAGRIDLGHAGQMTAAAAIALLMTGMIMMQLSDSAPPLVNAINQLTRIG